MATAMQDNNMGPAESTDMPMDDSTAQDPGAMPPEDQGNGVIHIPGDMLPESIRGKCKPGDKLTFEVVGAPDEEGDVPVEFESGAGYTESASEEAGEPWENEFRKAMSPRNPDEGSPMPEKLEEEGY